MNGTEEWKQIAGFEGLYDVSDQGRVRSWSRFKRGALLTPPTNPKNRNPRPVNPTSPQPTSSDRDQAQRLIEAVNEALTVPTSYRDDTPVPAYGPTPPVPQPGRPPMSQKATDTSALMLSGSVLTLATGAAATGILWASGHADPTVVACICAAPPALLLALSRVVKRFKETVEAAPPVIHQHYTGPVHQDHRTTSTTTRGVWAKTNNQLPR